MKTIGIVLMVLGALVLTVGFYFQFMQWPDLFRGTISGPIILIIGLILFLFFRVKKDNAHND